MADNPWLPAVVLGAAPHVGPMPPMPLPGEPGPFAWADADQITKVLDAAGFSRVRVEASDPVLRPVGEPDDIAVSLIELGPAAGAYRASAPAAQAAARSSVLSMLQRFPDMALPSGIWVITAERPPVATSSGT
jgi:hypothetical protein